MEELLYVLFPFAVVIVTLVLDPGNAIGGTAIGFMARQGFFGTSWPKFLGATVVVSALCQLVYWNSWPGYNVTVPSTLMGYAICLGCALVFGAKVFKLTGNVPRT
jgi:hypothetical protein